MKKFGIILVLVVISGIVVAFLLANRTNDGASSPSRTSPPPSTSSEGNSATNTAEEVQITIQNFAYEPKNITVKKGTKVTWTNKDSVKHDVASDDGSAAGGPKGPLLGKGESYSHTFETVGTFNYHCTPHPYMKASVIVTE